MAWREVLTKNTQILEVCYKSGVKVITVYAFSIENFKRSKKEVDALMEICKVKLVQISRHGDLLDMYGAKIQILGNRDLVKQDVLDAIDHAVEMTSKNTDTILNVCFPYTSRDEMATAIRNTVEDYSKSIRAPSKPLLQTRLAAIPETPVESPMHDDADDSVSSSSTLHPDSPPQIIIQEDDSPYLDPESITEATIEEHLFTAGNPPLDLLVRTSGVKRLSDFMLWQCHERTEIVFLDVLWPEFDLWHFLPILVEWQWRRKYAQIKEHAPVTSARPTKTIKVR